MNKIKYLAVLNVGIEEVHCFYNMEELLKYFDAKDLEEVKKNIWVVLIVEIKEVLYE